MQGHALKGRDHFEPERLDQAGRGAARDRDELFWQLVADSAYRTRWFREQAQRPAADWRGRGRPPTTGWISPEGLQELSNRAARQLQRCVLFGRPPAPLGELLAVSGGQTTSGEGRDDVTHSDFLAALWRAVQDPDFRAGCFGDARTTLAREGYHLSEEELGKFRWFDHEKLAAFGDTFHALVDELVASSPGGTTDPDDAMAAGAGDESPLTEAGADSTEEARAEDALLHELFLEHQSQVEAYRRRATELLADSPQFAPGEYDPGPPAPDEPVFLGLLQLKRVWGSDLNAILRDSGYSLGRWRMVSELLERRGVTLPPWRSKLTSNRRACEQWFLARTSEGRPQVDERFHQSPCDPRAVIGRVEHIARHNWLRHRSVLVLGDDDAVSIALARFTEADVHVIDIDERVLGFLERVAARNGLRVHLHHQDLRDSLPAELVGRFSLVSADPPQAAAGQVFFLDRAIDALLPEPGHRIYSSITPLWMGDEAYHLVLAHLIRRGFASREILKSQMLFPARDSFRPPSGRSATSALLDQVLQDTINMGCDVHVFQRFRSF